MRNENYYVKKNKPCKINHIRWLFFSFFHLIRLFIGMTILCRAPCQVLDQSLTFCLDYSGVSNGFSHSNPHFYLFLSFLITAVSVLLLKSQNLPDSQIKARHLMQGENLRLYIDLTEPFMFWNPVPFSTIIIIYSLFINF